MKQTNRTHEIPDADEIEKRMRSVFEKYGIQRAILFGSFAKGRQSRWSDIDLILVKQTNKAYFDRFEGILTDLYKTIAGRDIDVFIYTPEELERIRHRKFLHRALQDGRVIYESG